MITVESTTFALLLNPEASPPTDPSTGQPLARAKERVDHLIAELEREGETVLIPTPVLAEVLVKAGDGAPEIVERVLRSSRFKIADFDLRAAVELAAMTRDALASGDKSGGSSSPWQKVKLDRQIIAVARANGSDVIYSDDDGVARFAEALGMRVIKTWQLPLPPAPPPDLFSGLDSSPDDDA
jgi:predicted nucleic acid-binding protein